MGIIAPPEPVYALCSGGKDSFAVACALQEAQLLKGVVLIDTGIAADTWKDDVLKIIERQKWPYEIVPTTYRYEAFVAQYGFPGPGMHGMVMTYLKGRAIRQWKKLHKGAALASGVRADESQRRGWSVKFESQWEGVTVYAPILNWTTKETWEYVRARGYERPQTYLTFGISGDCMCGAFAMPHEDDAMVEYSPLLAARMRGMKPPDGVGWGERACRARTVKMLPEVEGQEIACFDCYRGDK